MKIVLVTWLSTGNYGTGLQSYALHKKLQEMGYDVCILPFFALSDFTLTAKIKKVVRYYPKYYAKLFLKRLFFESKSQRKLREFNNSNYNIRLIKTQAQYEELLKESDVFIAGSDQIWNCYHSFNPFYFLSFAGDKKRIAYASSIGTSDFPEEKKDQIKYLLSKFSHIGVREETAVRAVKDLIYEADVRQVADPTFLLDDKHWRNFACKATLEFDLPEKYILCYFVSNESYTIEQLETIKQKLDISNVIVIPAKENEKINIPEAFIYPDAGPHEFVYLLSHATCVCTDSFHATAISINMQKDFIEFKRFKDENRQSQNSRIYDLLEHYNLTARLYDSQEASLYNPINYTEITDIVERDRKDCIAYLQNSITG